MMEITSKDFNDIKIPSIITKPTIDIEKELLKLESKSPGELRENIVKTITLAIKRRLNAEMANDGFPSENTRKWIDTYFKGLSDIEKSKYGQDINVNLTISHSQIAAKVRENTKIIDINPNE